MPRWRPGHACGPAPNGSQAPGRCVSVLPPVGVEAGQAVGVAGHQLGAAGRGAGADEDDPPCGNRCPAEIDLASRDASGDPRRRGQAQGLPDGVHRVRPRPPGGWPSQAEQEGAGGDRNLDARRPAWSPPAGVAPCEDPATAARASSSASRASLAPCDVPGSTDAGGRWAAMTGPSASIQPRTRSATRSRRAVEVERGQDRGRRRSGHRTTQQQHGVVRLAAAASRSCVGQCRVPLGGRRRPAADATCSGLQRAEERRARSGSRPGCRTGRRCG